jgi:intracellular sulfur oxidation DsrE/DsrF family protein
MIAHKHPQIAHFAGTPSLNKSILEPRETRLFHLDKPRRDRADQVFKKIANLLAELGENSVDVELVANGGGVKALVNGHDSHADQVDQLAANGVCYSACAYSLSTPGIAKESLLESVDVVSAGVAELVKKQAAGWAYLRPQHEPRSFHLDRRRHVPALRKRPIRRTEHGTWSVLSEVQGVDICLTGHTHDRLREPVLQWKTLVIQSGCHGSFLGR